MSTRSTPELVTAVVWVLAAGSLSACDDTIAPNQVWMQGEVAFIAGRILDDATREGIAGAMVEVSDVGTTIARKDGSYLYSELGALPTVPSVTISAAASGYIPAVISVNIERQPLRIPALRLTRLGSPREIGPDGGVVANPTGATLRVPAGALSRTAELTLTPLPITADRGLTHPQIVRALAVTHLGPEETQFAVPVQITVRLWKRMEPNSQLRMSRVKDPGSEEDSVGTAVVSADGLSATFSTSSGGKIVVDEGNTRYRWEAAGNDSTVDSTRINDGATVGCTTQFLATPVRAVATELATNFDARFNGLTVSIADQVGAFSTTPSYPIFPPLIHPYTHSVARRGYHDRVRSPIRLYEEKLQPNGTWKQVGTVGTGSYTRTVFRWQIATKRPCHNQGEGTW